MARPDVFPVVMVNVHDGREFSAETLLQFNNLAVKGWKVKDKKQKDEVAPPVTVASGPVVSDSQPSDSTGFPAVSENASARPSLRRK